MSAGLSFETRRDDSRCVLNTEPIPDLTEIRNEQEKEKCHRALEHCESIYRDEEAIRPELTGFFANFINRSTIFSQIESQTGTLESQTGMPDWVRRGCIITHEAYLMNAVDIPDAATYYRAYEMMASGDKIPGDNIDGYIKEFWRNNELLADTIYTYAERYVHSADQVNTCLHVLCGAAMTELAWQHTQTDRQVEISPDPVWINK